MRITVTLILLAAAPCLFAQPVSIPETRIETVDGWKVHVENNTKSSVVALHATFRCPATPSHQAGELEFVMDPLYNYGSDRPIPAGEPYEFKIPHGWECPGGVDAVLYADGHSEGDPAAVEILFQQRVGVSEAIDLSTKVLDQVSHSTVQPTEAASQLKAMSKRVSLNESKSVGERQGEMYVFTVVAGLLTRQNNWRVPSDLRERNQPSIEDTMKVRGVLRQQAHAIVINSKLQEWSLDLKNPAADLNFPKRPAPTP